MRKWHLNAIKFQLVLPLYSNTSTYKYTRHAHTHTSLLFIIVKSNCTSCSTWQALAPSVSPDTTFPPTPGINRLKVSKWMLLAYSLYDSFSYSTECESCLTFQESTWDIQCFRACCRCSCDAVWSAIRVEVQKRGFSVCKLSLGCSLTQNSNSGSNARTKERYREQNSAMGCSMWPASAELTWSKWFLPFQLQSVFWNLCGLK